MAFNKFNKINGKLKPLNEKGINVFYMPQFIAFVFLILVVIVLLFIFFIVYQNPAGAEYGEMQSTTTPDLEFSKTQILDYKIMFNKDNDLNFIDRVDKRISRTSGHVNAIKLKYYNSGIIGDINKGGFIFYLEKYNLRDLTYKQAIIELYKNNVEVYSLFYVTPDYLILYSSHSFESLQGSESYQDLFDCNKYSIVISNIDSPIEFYACAMRIEK